MGAVQVLLLGAVQAAQTVGIGRSKFLQLVTTGNAPKPIRLGRRVLWRVSDLEAWAQNGCKSWGAANG